MASREPVLNPESALKNVRIAFTAAIVLAVAGYAAAPLFPAPAQATTAVHAYSLDTPIEDIAATPAGTAILDRDMPGLLQHPSYPMFKSMSLRLVGRLSGGRLANDTMTKVEADLASLPPPTSPLRRVSQTYADPEFK